MDINERVEKRSYLYRVKDGRVILGKHYYKNKIAFHESTYNLLFQVMLNEYIDRHGEFVKEFIMDNGEMVVYLDVDSNYEMDFITYVEGELCDFLITRQVDFRRRKK